MGAELRNELAITHPFDPTVEGYRGLLDAIPTSLLVIDCDVRVVAHNRAAGEFVENVEARLYQAPGIFLRCLHPIAEGQPCGDTPYCRDCAIRRTVGEALAGNRVVRVKAPFVRVTAGGRKAVTLYVSAAPYGIGDERCAVLALEDITEVEDLRHFIPMCAACKKVRDPEGHWYPVEQFLDHYSATDVSHGICPECAVRLYGPDVASGASR